MYKFQEKTILWYAFIEDSVNKEVSLAFCKQIPFSLLF